MKKKFQGSVRNISLTAVCVTMGVAIADQSALAAVANVHSASQVQKMATYNPPITITLGRANDTTITFLPGQSYDHNDVYTAYQKQMGIYLKNEWVVDSNTYDTKVNLSIASGNIPDLLFVSNEEQLKQLVNAGMVMDLSPFFKKDLSPLAKTYFTDKEQMASATFDGKLMAIPATNSPYNSANFMFIRKDWLNKLGLPAPKTMQDFLKIASAFSTQNPGGAKVTYGLAATNDLNNSALGLQGLFNAYHAYPEIWVKNSAGKLVYGSVQPQMKPALAALQQMYKKGEIDPGFAVKDTNTEAQLIANNQVGMAFGYFWLPSWPLIQAIRVNNKITQDWQAYPLPSIDNKPAKSEVPIGLDGYWVISKNCQHPDAVMELLNRWVWMNGPAQNSNAARVLANGNSNNQRDNYWKLNPIDDAYSPQAQDPIPVLNALKLHSNSLLKNAGDLSTYQQLQQYLHGDTNLWNTWAKYGPNGSVSVMYNEYKQHQYVQNQFYAAPSQTMTNDWGNLESLLSQGFMQIITNKKPISYFDTLVQQWNALGGLQITQDVNSKSSAK